ncbi:hypothetical protein RRF57_004814 [Xylaria bambusicola]|uniref:Uncharacterized protein n=1 Tax=Xylaria bambusicola TaxID=326684 RepID=A0AAN7UNT2_9PEZI
MYRDAEHRESLSSTLRTLRTDNQRQSTEYARQTERLDDTQRRLDTAEATERALRAQLKTAEQGIHTLKDQMAKMKSVVAQTRNACANEVRKRDRHIDSLKKAVADAGRVRGSGKSRDVITINVTGSDGNEGDEGMGMPVGATEDEGYSLRMETNGFLTELAKGLSEENEGLLALVQRTINGLREMSGLDRGTNPGHEQSHDSSVRNEFVTQLPQKSAEELAAELQAIVEHLRSILTNPSFVPIEEVEARDEVIAGLRTRLNTTLAKWKDTMLMIDGWRRRMESSGKPVDVEDLLLSLSPVRVREVEETANVEPMRLSCVQEEDEEEEEQVSDRNQRNQDETPEPRRFRSQSPVESLRLVPAPDYNEDPDDDSDSDSSIFQDDLDDDIDVEEPNTSYSLGNRGAVHTSPYRKRPGDFTTIVEENTWDLAAAGEKEVPISPRHESKVSSPQVDDDGMPSYTASYDSPLFGKSGERPTEADLNRKLFSKPSEPRPRSTAIGTTLSQRAQVSPPQPTRTTRSNARKATEKTSPTAGYKAAAIRAVVDTDEDIVPSTALSTNTSVSTTNTTTTTGQRKRPAQQHSSTNSEEADRDNKHPRTRSPTRAQNAAVPASSRLPRPHVQQQSPLNMATIAAKLAASEREADAARVRAKLRAVRRSRRISGAPPEDSSSSHGQTQTPTETQIESSAQRAESADATATDVPRENVDPVKKDVEMGTGMGIGIRKAPKRRINYAPVGDDVDELGEDDLHLNSHDGTAETSIRDAAGEREGRGKGEGEAEGENLLSLQVTKHRKNRAAVRAGKVASRRRSTLSPWELQGLISGAVESPGR